MFATLAVMKLVSFIITAFTALRIEDVYVNDPKKSFNPNWASMALVLQHNQEWRQELKSDKFQRDFVDEMINMDKAIPLTPVTAIRQVDETPHCWVVLAYHSGDDDNLPGIKGVGRALTQLFYERCGVAFLDMAYPSNHYTFGPVIDQTPMILFRKPNAQHQMFHADHLHPDKTHFQLDKLHKWGYPFTSDEMKSDIMMIIHQLNFLYEKWVEPNYKTIATVMEHYTDEKKKYVKMLIQNLLRHFHDDAEVKAKSLGLMASDQREDLYTTEEIDDNDERFFQFIIHYIHESVTKIDLTKWLSTQLESTLKDESLNNDDKKEMLRYISPIKPRSQPFVGHLLQSWLHFHNEL